MDLSKLPTGLAGWQALIDATAASDDRIERHYLEVKSDVDLNTKAGQAKVAKFVLGAAHRDPTIAQRYLGGHALLVLGVAPGPGAPHTRISGIPGFETHELRRAVTKYTGEPGPPWDHVLVHVPDSSSSVTLIVVDPPTGQIWPCLTDGDGLTNGTIYLRRDGETSKANGPELTQLLGRHAEHAHPSSPAVDLTVRLSGQAHRLDPLNQVLDAHIQNNVSALQWAYDFRRDNGISGGMTDPEDRTPEEYLKQIEDWSRVIRDEWRTIVPVLATISTPGASIEIINSTKTFFTGVRVDITLDVPGDLEVGNRPCVVDDQHEMFEQLLEEIPERPRLWGPRPFQHISPFRSPALIAPMVNRPTLTFTGEALTISHRISELRPRDTYRGGFEDEVLLFLPPAAAGTPIRGRWAVTADGHHDVYEGELEVAIADDPVDVSTVLLPLLEERAGHIPSQ